VCKRITLPYLSILRIFIRCVMSPGYREWRVIFSGKLRAPSTFSNKSYSRSAIWISWGATPVIRVPLERLSYLFFAPSFVCSFLNDFPQRSPPYTFPSPIDHTQSPRTRCPKFDRIEPLQFYPHINSGRQLPFRQKSSSCSTSDEQNGIQGKHVREIISIFCDK